MRACLTQIANETGAAPGGTLYADALSSADGPAATYIDMFRHNAALLTTSMAGRQGGTRQYARRPRPLSGPTTSRATTGSCAGHPRPFRRSPLGL